MRSSENPEGIRPRRYPLRLRHAPLPTIQPSDWLRASTTPAGGLAGSMVLNLAREVVRVWERWKDWSAASEAWSHARPLATAFVIGGLSGWLVVSQSSLLSAAVAAVAVAVALAVGLLG